MHVATCVSDIIDITGELEMADKKKYNELFEIMTQGCDDLESDGIDSEFMLDCIDDLVDALNGKDKAWDRC